MSDTGLIVTVTVDGGPSVQIKWSEKMRAQDALESAWNEVNSTDTFTFGLQYYGKALGYMVYMVNETYDSFVSSSAPYFYCEFLVNGKPQTKGLTVTN